MFPLTFNLTTPHPYFPFYVPLPSSDSALGLSARVMLLVLQLQNLKKYRSLTKICKYAPKYLSKHNISWSKYKCIT